MQLAYSRAALHLSWQRLADLEPDGRLSAQLERNRRPPDTGDAGKSPSLLADERIMEALIMTVCRFGAVYLSGRS